MFVMIQIRNGLISPVSFCLGLSLHAMGRGQTLPSTFFSHVKWQIRSFVGERESDAPQQKPGDTFLAERWTRDWMIDGSVGDG